MGTNGTNGSPGQAGKAGAPGSSGAKGLTGYKGGIHLVMSGYIRQPSSLTLSVLRRNR